MQLIPAPVSAVVVTLMLFPVGPVVVAMVVNWSADLKGALSIALRIACGFGRLPIDLTNKVICCMICVVLVDANGDSGDCRDDGDDVLELDDMNVVKLLLLSPIG